MSNLVLSREIWSPLDVVWDYHTDLSRLPEFWPNLSQCRRIDGRSGPVEPGVAFQWQYNMLGRHFTGTFTVREVLPKEKLVFEAAGQISAVFRHIYQPTAKSRTRVTVLVDYTVPGLLARAVNVLFVERRNAADAEHALDQLKEHLEADAMARVDAGVV